MVSLRGNRKATKTRGKAVEMCMPHSLRDLQLETPHHGVLGDMAQPRAELYFLCGARN